MVKPPVKYFGYFFFLILLSLFATYIAPTVVTILFYLIILWVYYKSEDEPFWLAYFLVLSDGFSCFFGRYTAVITLIPGYPGIEVVQFYIVLALIKALKRGEVYQVFYNKYISILGLYALFLVGLGISFRLSGSVNIYFRVFKLLFPLLLFYILPKHFKSRFQYTRFFRLVFPIVIIAFVTQIFDITYGVSLGNYLGLSQSRPIEVSEARVYRGFYNVGITLISYFGALYYLHAKEKYFHPYYLSFIVFISNAIVLLSATRGWILGFSVILFLHIILNIGNVTKHVSLLLLIIFVGFITLSSVSKVSNQIKAASKRLSTTESILYGDLSASGTSIRATLRGPEVMSVWENSKVFGFGFSDIYFEEQDGHVGNQNLLLHSGLLGMGLLYGFFVSFLLRMFYVYRLSLSRKLLSFISFFVGWFIIHSSSGQQFGFFLHPDFAIVQSVFFSIGALEYDNVFKYYTSRNKKYAKNIF